MDAPLTAARRARCQIDHCAPAIWPTLRFDGHLHIDAEGDEPAYTLEQRTCTACRSSFSRPVESVDLAAPFQPPSPADLTNTWSWVDRTEGFAALGHPAKQTRYIEVTADGACTIVCLDDTGISHFRGVEIDWLDVVERDVNGRRLHERVGADSERSAA